MNTIQTFVSNVKNFTKKGGVEMIYLSIKILGVFNMKLAIKTRKSKFKNNQTKKSIGIKA